jgi:hypothetical protein
MGIHKSQRAGFAGAVGFSEIGAVDPFDERGFLRRVPLLSRYDELDSLDRLPSPWGFFVTTFLVAVFFVGCLSGVGLDSPRLLASHGWIYP